MSSKLKPSLLEGGKQLIKTRTVDETYKAQEVKKTDKCQGVPKTSKVSKSLPEVM